MFQGLPIKARPMRPSDNAFKQDWCRHKMLAALVAACCSPNVCAAAIRRMNVEFQRAIVLWQHCWKVKPPCSAAAHMACLRIGHVCAGLPITEAAGSVRRLEAGCAKTIG